MQLSDIRSKLRRKIGNPTTGDVPNADLDEHINDAYRDVATKFKHHKARKLCMFDTVDGTASYGLPSVAGSVFKVWDTTTPGKLSKKGPHWYASIATEHENGQPLYYVRFRQHIILVPTPDGVYTLEIFYTDTITDLTNDSDVPVLPETWTPAIWMLARWYYYDDQGDMPKADKAFDTYRIWLSDKPSEIEEESVDIDSGAELPTLTNQDPRLDFDHSP